MTYFPTPDHAMNHPRHSTGSNTPEDQVAAFLANTPMIRCEPYRCLISEKECRARRDRAKRAKRVIIHHYERCTMASNEYQRLEKCAKCGRTP